MKAKAAPSTVQTARLREFVEQVDSRLLLLLSAAKVPPSAAEAAEIARLERLRDLALQLLDAEAAA